MGNNTEVIKQNYAIFHTFINLLFMLVLEYPEIHVIEGPIPNHRSSTLAIYAAIKVHTDTCNKYPTPNCRSSTLAIYAKVLTDTCNECSLS